MRIAASCGHAPASGLHPATCRWMDAGMFARWILADAGEPGDLLIELGALVPAREIEALTAVVDAWDTG